MNVVRRICHLKGIHMTYFSPLRAILTLCTALSLSAALPAASAYAADDTMTFTVKTASDSTVISGVSAYKKGDYQKAVSIMRVSLKSSLSSRRAALVQSNLCAAYGELGEMDKAQAACSAALELRPDYAPALSNKAALTTRLALNLDEESG